MAPEDRRARERQEVRGRLLGAAWDLFGTLPADEVTVRAIADRAEYSPRTLYLYFADKEALWGAVVEEAYRRTLEASDAGAGEAPGPAFLRALVARHVDQALAEPRLYEAVCGYLARPGVLTGPCRQAVEARISGILEALGAFPVMAGTVPLLLRAFTQELVREGLGPGDPEAQARTGAFTDFVFRGLGIQTA